MDDFQVLYKECSFESSDSKVKNPATSAGFQCLQKKHKAKPSNHVNQIEMHIFAQCRFFCRSRQKLHKGEMESRLHPLPDEQLLEGRLGWA